MFSLAHNSPVSSLAIIRLSGSSPSEFPFLFSRHIALALSTSLNKVWQNLMIYKRSDSLCILRMKALKSRLLTQKVEEWREENSRVELEVFKLTSNFILPSHTFKLLVTETCVCAGYFNLRGSFWSVIFTNAELQHNIIHAGANSAK